MRHPEDTEPRLDETRIAELALIFAAAILRLRHRNALTESESSDTSKTCLEVPPETVLSGHHG